MLEALALLILVIAGAPIALVLLHGSRVLFAGAVVTSVLATIAGVLHVATGIPITITWLGLILLCYVPIATIGRLRTRALANLRAGLTRTEVIELALVGVVVVVAVALVPAPLSWDARSIWLFHASWLSAEPSAFIDGQTLATTEFSHPDYPILGPASIATTWGLLGGAENLALGVQVVALLSILVAALGASIAVARFGRGSSLVVTSLAFFGYVTAVLAVALGVATAGYMDPLQAAFIATLVALLVTSFAPRPTSSRLAMTTVVAVGAINVKQEGLWFALVALGVYLVLSVRDQYLRKYVPLAVMLGFYAGWKFFLAAVKSPDTSDASGIVARLPELLDRSSVAWSVVRRMLRHEFLGLTAMSLVTVIVLLIAVAVARRSARTVQQMAFVAITPIGIAFIILLTYALGNSRDRIDWWLATSFDRVIATTQLVSWFGVLLAVLILSPWRLSAPRRDATNC